ncbi:cupin-like domain-containing protein [Janthinobacterium sp. GB4P2]|uniref:cupin-like domain-containing protein n=1 Tax=Janthinobacterium sp. GB4P2 TaxID=3424189 RepID=UPI003F247AFC
MQKFLHFGDPIYFGFTCGPMTKIIENIRRIDSFPTGPFSENMGLLSAPFVVTGHVKKWPAFKRWTAKFFSEYYGKKIVEIFSQDGNSFQMSIEEYVSYFNLINSRDEEGNAQRSKKFYYLKDWDFEREFPGLQNDYTTPDLFLSWTDALPLEYRPTLRWIYIGVKGTRSAMHLDTLNSSAWNGVIQGRKAWRFIPPTSGCEISSINSNSISNEQLLGAITCIQNAGDLVFTPSNWLHEVENLESGISITENFVNSTNHHLVRRYLHGRHEMDNVAILDDLIKKNLYF